MFGLWKCLIGCFKDGSMFGYRVVFGRACVRWLGLFLYVFGFVLILYKMSNNWSVLFVLYLSFGFGCSVF